jgi:glycosyltransferase involved in cell wall biosynthesis
LNTSILPVFSIIIPHKNTPDLLQRCLASIPRRNDLEIIVIDDNSDSRHVDFDHFPCLNDPVVVTVFKKEGKGAGYARNTGLARARGKWLLFADADDFYNYCLSSFLDDYADAAADLVFYKANCIDSNTFVCAHRNDQSRLNSCIDLYKSPNCRADYCLRYVSSVPWGKMIRKSLVDGNNIKFDETQKSNDVTFSYLAGHYADRIMVDKRAVYCVTLSDNSIGYSALTLEKKLDFIYVTGKEKKFFYENNIRYFGNSAAKMLFNLFISDNSGYVRGKDILFDLGYSKNELMGMLFKAFFINIFSFFPRALFFITNKTIRIMEFITKRRI